MKIAVLSDIHGNIPAFEAVMEALSHEAIDKIVCLGDICNPFFESDILWQKLKDLGIPVTRGNHEDYIIDYHIHKKMDWDIPVFQALKSVAKHLGPEMAHELIELPMEYRFDDIHFCHGLPQVNTKSFLDGVDDALLIEFKSLQAKVFVSGHRHNPSTKVIGDIQLVSIGSVGIPQTNGPKPQFTILTKKNNQWSADHREIDYPVMEAFNQFFRGNLIQDSGAIIWTLMDEILTGEKRIAEIFPWFLRNGGIPSGQKEFEIKVIEFLKSIGRWKTIKKYL